MRNIKETERILKALANGRRLAIVKFLAGCKHASVGEIAEHIELSFKSTSRHLSVLTSGAIVDRKQVSTTVLYHLCYPHGSILKTVLSIL